jgi:hypothetical protein
MKPLRDRYLPDNARRSTPVTRRRARAFEAFMSQQILALHRTGIAARGGLAVLAPPSRETADQSC